MKTYKQLLEEFAPEKIEETIEEGVEYVITLDEKKLDDVEKGDLKKDHEDLKDKDIDNDGDVDDSDEYLHNRRKKISKSIKQQNEDVKAGKLKLADGSLIDVSDDDAKIINDLFASLGEKGKKAMMDTMFDDQASFDELVAMAKDA